MEITEIERDIINTVVQRFAKLGQSTTRKELLRKFRNIAAIDAVLKGPFFSHGSQGDYLPRPSAFQCCGDPDSLVRAQTATEIALRILQNLDEAYPERDPSGVFTLEEFLHHASKMYESRPAETVLKLGLYLAQYFNVFSHWGGMEGQPGAVTQFGFQENIITIDPIHAWAAHIKEIDDGKVLYAAEMLVNHMSDLQEPSKALPVGTSNGRETTRTTVLSSGFEEYKVVRQIGCGGSGTVFEVLDAAGQRLALKTLNPAVPHAKIKRFKNEIQFCLRPPSARILRVLDYGRTDDGSPFYVMPLYPRTLRDRIRNGIPAADVLPLFNQILDAVEAAHLLSVYHRDIKPENILCDTQGDLVLADFGIAHFQEDELLTTVNTGPNERLANFAYAAPEQRFAGEAVDHRADIYALGLILNEMYTKHVIHGTGFRRIKDTAAAFAYLDDLVDSMIQQQPNQRPQTVRRIKEELVARGNEFVKLQKLDELKRQAVPESDIDDPIVNDPIRVIEKIDYMNGILTLRLNRAVNRGFEECFRRRATRFNANVSAASISFQGDTALVIVTEHFLQESVNYLKEYLVIGNEEYGIQVRKDHQQRIDQAGAALKAQIANAEARARTLQKIVI